MEIILFHHSLGLTAGVRAFAEDLGRAGHTVHTPDLFEGRTFKTIPEGMAHAEAIGFPDAILARSLRAVAALPKDVVYAGISLGVVVAEKLAQSRPGACGALLLESFVPLRYIGPWPAGLPAQIHGMATDPYFAGEGDLEAARAFVAETPASELFVYEGDQHLFCDRGLGSYRPEAAALVLARSLQFLDRVAALAASDRAGDVRMRPG